ncbi:DUF3486 family protein [Cardiobacterium sp. AH-315-I02]|nr:DUF3486 family protein [Cardiobacterium sp. AH-315-I02]
MSKHKEKLRRLRILQILARYQPLPLGERALLNLLQNDVELKPTIEKVRTSLRYLASWQLVDLIEVDHVNWLAAAISKGGVDWLCSGVDHNLEIHNPDYRPPEIPAAYNGRNSAVNQLPIEARAWIDDQLITGNFSGYQALVDMLNAQGLIISRSSLGRYAKKLKDKVAKYKEKAEMVKSLAFVFEDDAPAIMQGAMGTAVTAVLDAIEDGEYSADKESLSSLVKALPGLGRGLQQAEKHKIEQQARRDALSRAKDEGTQIIQSMGLDDSQVKIWREKFLIGR